MPSHSARAVLCLVATAFALCSADFILYHNTNAADGAGDKCVDHGPFRCLGARDAFACRNQCFALGNCAVAVFSETTAHCWARTDNNWQPVHDAGVVSFCNDSVIAACVPQPSSRAVNATVAAVASHRTHALSPAVTLDFWRADDPKIGFKWNTSGGVAIDLQSPTLRGLARSLAPGMLRLGGSPEDSLVFDVDGSCVPGSGGMGPSKDYFCSQVQPYVYDCLTAQRWNALLQFGAEVGLKIVLGLNGCYGRKSVTSAMDYSNIALLFNATVKSPHVAALWGFEFTNEVMPKTIAPAAWVKDLVAIQRMATDIFKKAGLHVPLFAGPDNGLCTPIAMVAPLLPARVAAAYTYHEYPQCLAPTPPAGFVLQPSCLAELDYYAWQCVWVAKNDSKKPVPGVWAGETADHNGGGVPGTTDTFRSSFYYAWQLGALHSSGVELVARQCFSGGDYELAQRGTGLFAPNPDYWVVWLFHVLVGGGASTFDVAHSTDVITTGVRVFAFSASAATNASLALLVINLQDNSRGNKPVMVNLKGREEGGRRVEFHLSGNVLTPHGTVYCNGKRLRIDSSSYDPPNWQSLGVDAQGPMVVEPSTIVFALVH